MRISFFFPAYHDEGTIEPLVRLADEVLGEVATEHEIIVVDDCSPDRSGAIADRLAAENPRVRVIHHPRNKGYGQALWSGFQAARLDWVAFTDGDMQYDLHELPALIERAKAGADAVVGYKTQRAEGWRRSVLSRAYNLAVRSLLSLPLRDVDCAFKLLRRELVQGVTPSTEYTEAFLMVELLYRARQRGARVEEVPVSHRERPWGESRCFSFRTARRLTYYLLRGAVVGRALGRWR
ncbi:MAG: glycosyltransferase family 2 protein [Polyangia bacterium]|jgi:glycosyltransferase involved in cell wall biosynthesis|nr:glycosyltransferase family 2 protein [Polyangia bacterium]